MKRMLLLCLSVISLATAQAQVYGPLLTEGKTWVYETYDVVETDEDVYVTPYDISFTLRGDTVINGKIYKKLYYNGRGKEAFHFALREEGSTIYRIRQRGKEFEECVLMDFDPVKITEYLVDLYNSWGFKDTYNGVIVDRVDFVTVRGRTFRRHRFSDAVYDDPMWAAEGIGFSYDGILGMNRPQYWYQEHFKACYDGDGNLLFTEGDFWGPGDATAVEGITTKESASSSGIFDLQGRCLSSKPKRGMYIQNGKKYVVK